MSFFSSHFFLGGFDVNCRAVLVLMEFSGVVVRASVLSAPHELLHVHKNDIILGVDLIVRHGDREPLLGHMI